MLHVDISPNHDGSGTALYLVAPDGADSLLYERDDAHDVAVSPDGRYLAYSRGTDARDGVWLVTRGSGAERRIVGQGTALSFSRDSQHVAIEAADGSASSYAVDGTHEITLPNARRVVWVARR